MLSQMAMTVPTADIGACREAHARLLDTIATVTDETARRPSLLPGWTIGHVLSHVARNADSVVRRLDAASASMVVDQYEGGAAGRARQIDAGAGRSAAALIADVRDTADAVDRAFASVADDVWDRPVRSVSGEETPAHTMVFSRWREVEVHHADLGLGYTLSSWPAGLVDRWLPALLTTLPRRADPAELLAWMLGRGAAPQLLSWG